MLHSDVTQSHRLSWIDSLRGLACLLVVLLHYFHTCLLIWEPWGLQASISTFHQDVLRETIHFYDAFPQGQWVHSVSQFLIDWVDVGKFGVVLFFIISGFIIPASLLKPQQHPIQTFVWGRFFRLYPIYWLSLLVTIIGYGWILNAKYSWISILANATMFHKFMKIDDINGVAWTLQIELAFYILCVILKSLDCLAKPKTAALGIFTAAILALFIAWLRFNTQKPYPVAFFLGLEMMFIGLWLYHAQTTSWFKIRWKDILCIGGLLLLTVFLAYQILWLNYWMTYALGIVLFLTCLKYKWNNSFLTWTGKISYTVYLFHPVLGWLLLPTLMQWLKPLLITMPLLILLPLFLAAAIVYCISWLIWATVEWPSWQWGKRWIQARLNV